MSGSCIEGCILSSSAACTVKGRGSVGGLLGCCDGGVVAQSVSHGSVVSDGSAETVGGLVGSIGVRFPTSVLNSYSDASVNGNYCVGGLIGELGLDTTVTNCYSTGKVTGGILAGGLVGFAGNWVGYEPDVNGSCWDRLASGQTTSAGGEARTTAQMQTAQHVPRCRLGLRGRDGQRDAGHLVDFRRAGLSATVVGAGAGG